MSTRRNIAANFAGRVWSVASVYLFLPIYLRLLGAEAYGVVGFFSVLQGVLAVADLGLTATMSREMARRGVSADPAAERRDLARSLEVPYAAIALAVGAACALAAPALAARWLHARTLPPGELVEAVRLMGVAIALQLPGSLYIGGLTGLERQVAANGIQIGWSLLRSGGSALALWLVAPTVRTWFVVVIAANLLYLLSARAALWRAVTPPGGVARPRFRGDLLRATWRYSAGMALMAVLSTVLIQLDKLIVSHLMPLAVFAHYSLASVLAQAPVIVAWAIAGAVFPRLTALAVAGPDAPLRALYHRACQLVSVVAIPLGLTVATFAPEVLAFWTRSPQTAATAGPAARLLLLGSTALALQIVPYQLALAFGWVGLNLRLATASLVLMVPGLWWLVSRFGLAGAGWAWLALNAGTLPILVVALHRRVLRGATAAWAITDVGRPLVATVVVLGAFRALAAPGGSIGRAFLVALAAGLTAVAAAALVTPAARSWRRVRAAEAGP